MCPWHGVMAAWHGETVGSVLSMAWSASDHFINYVELRLGVNGTTVLLLVEQLNSRAGATTPARCHELV